MDSFQACGLRGSVFCRPQFLYLADPLMLPPRVYYALHLGERAQLVLFFKKNCFVEFIYGHPDNLTLSFLPFSLSPPARDSPSICSLWEPAANCFGRGQPAGGHRTHRTPTEKAGAKQLVFLLDVSSIGIVDDGTL